MEDDAEAAADAAVCVLRIQLLMFRCSESHTVCCQVEGFYINLG